jgi:hypothetical protein
VTRTLAVKATVGLAANGPVGVPEEGPENPTVGGPQQSTTAPEKQTVEPAIAPVEEPGNSTAEEHQHATAESEKQTVEPVIAPVEEPGNSTAEERQRTTEESEKQTVGPVIAPVEGPRNPTAEEHQQTTEESEKQTVEPVIAPVKDPENAAAKPEDPTVASFWDKELSSYRGKDSESESWRRLLRKDPFLGSATDVATEDLDFRSLITIATLFVLSPLYGGIHLTAWNFKFPSHTEMILWKVSCLIIIGYFVATFVLLFCIGLLLACVPGRVESTAGYIVIGVIVILSSFPYILSRLYIVAESFISLRYVPIGVYSAVPWVQNIPHI